MKDGRVKIKFENGKIVGLTIDSGLTGLYEDIFKKARRALLKNDSAENGLRAILFGCFWLEAMGNEKLEILINNEIKNQEFSRVIWEILKQKSFNEKIKILDIFSPNKLSDCQKPFSISQVFELRNRLVHYKSDETAISGESNLFQALIGTVNAPDTKLMNELYQPKIEEHVENMIRCGNWLNPPTRKTRKLPKSSKKDNGQGLVMLFKDMLLEPDGIEMIIHLVKWANNNETYLQSAETVFRELGTEEGTAAIEKLRENE